MLMFVTDLCDITEVCDVRHKMVVRNYFCEHRQAKLGLRLTQFADDAHTVNLNSLCTSSAILLPLSENASSFFAATA